MPLIPIRTPIAQAIAGCTSSAVLASAATRTFSPIGNTTTSAADPYWVVPANGTLSNLKTRLDVASQATFTIDFTVQVDEVDSTLTTSHANADGTAVKSDAVNTVTVTAGQRVRIKVVAGGTQAGCDGSWVFDYARS